MNFPSGRCYSFLAICSALLAAQLACGLGNQPAAAPLVTQPAAPTQAINVPLAPAIPEARMLTLEYPPTIRAGDAEVVRLILEVDQNGKLTPTAEIAGHLTRGESISIPNVYETYNLMAEARLDLAGMEVRPAETVSETLLPGQTVTFYWSVRPADVGRYKGTVWFYLRFIPKAGGADSRQALSAQLIQIESVALFGIKAGMARWLGLLGTILSSVIGFPFLEEALKWAWRRLGKGR